MQLKEAAELMGRVLTGDEEWSISSSEMAVVNDIRSSSEICKELLSYYIQVLIQYTTCWCYWVIQHVTEAGVKKTLKKVMT